MFMTFSQFRKQSKNYNPTGWFRLRSDWDWGNGLLSVLTKLMNPGSRLE